MVRGFGGFREYTVIDRDEVVCKCLCSTTSRAASHLKPPSENQRCVLRIFARHNNKEPDVWTPTG